MGGLGLATRAQSRQYRTFLRHPRRRPQTGVPFPLHPGEWTPVEPSRPGGTFWRSVSAASR